MTRRQRIEMCEQLASAEGRTLFQEAVRRFRKNKLAMAGLTVLIILIMISFATIIVDLVTSGSFYESEIVKMNLAYKLKGPSGESYRGWFGYDEFGRSMLFRMIWGTRYSLFISICAISIATCIGGVLGSIAGYYGGRIDNVIMRVMDVFLAIPYMLLAIAIMAALGQSIFNLLISIAIPEIPGFARIVRASVMSVKDREYVESAKAAGANDLRVITKYIIPNAIAPVIVQATLSTANAILSIAALSYIGLGIVPPTPEWGAMLTSAKNYIRDAWHITIVPGLGIMLATLSINVFGDGLRDALDPKLKN